MRIASVPGSVLLRHPVVTVTLVLALIASPVALWYVHTHPVWHTEVCSYRIHRYNKAKGTPYIPVYEPVYCSRPAGR
jgi:hypothetical protein